MNKKLLLLLAVFCLASGQTIAQNPPCPTPPPPGAENCQGACVYCDFDGYMGINNGTPSGGNSGCPGIAIHNDQWFGFTAGSESITITIFTSGCANGDGLQSAFWDDCSDGDALACNPGQPNGGNDPLVLTYDNFTIGETYFLFLDGWSGDVCDFEIDITDGSITPPPPDNALQPQGPTSVCPGAQVVYTIDDVFGAGSYIWTAPPGSLINGLPSPANIDAPEGTMVTITFGNVGGNVCVTADNACNPPSAQNCLPVANMPIPATILPPLVICYEDAPFMWEEEPFPILNLPGVFTLTSSPYESWLGCDSIIKQTITIKQIAPTNIGNKYICQGECFMLGGDSYCDQGNYTIVYDSYNHCDSAVTFQVIVLDPVAAIPAPTSSIDCNSAGVVLQSTGSTPLGQAIYSWQNATWNHLAGTTTFNATLTGTYHLIVMVQGGGVQCRDTANVLVTGSTVAPGASASGGNISCIALQTTLTGNSPTGNVNYTWTGPGINAGNQFLQNPTVDQIGVYVLTVKNPANGCTSTATVIVNGDITPPSASAVGGIITCLQTSITLDGITNAPSPTWSWTGPGITPGNQSQENPNVVQAGTYTVTVTNTANGCTNSAAAVVDINNTHPTGTAGPNDTLTCTFPNVVLQGTGNGGAQPISFSWTGPNGFMSNIAQPSVNVAGTYILTVLNTQNGCLKKDTVEIAANQQVPTALAGADSIINCVQPSVFLIGGASSIGLNFTATWSGPGINAGNSNLYNPEVDQPGTYDLLITNITNGCTATDQVVVNINTALPTADAGTDQQLTCSSTNGVTLSGSGFPPSATYFWTGPGIGADNETLQNPTVTQPGTYDLLVANPGNGCTATDQVIVTQDADVPTADGGLDQVLNCSVFSVDFDGTGSSVGIGIMYAWTGPGISGNNQTAQSPTGLTMPGIYHLTVTNTNNNCSNTDVVVIQIDTIHPTADAGNPLALNCYNNATDTLDASGSSLGSIFSLLWSGMGINAGNQNSTNPVINSQPGVYSLTVTNTENTCTATDQVNVALDQAAPTADAGIDKTIDCVVTSAVIGVASSPGTNFSYLWTGPGIDGTNQTLATPTIDQAGLYTILVANLVNGCTASNDVLINTNAVLPTAVAGNDGLLTCTSPTAILDGSGSSMGADFATLWTGPGINAGNQGQPSPSVAVQGMYIVQITNTVNSCVTRDTVLVEENKVPPTAFSDLDVVLNCQTTSAILELVLVPNTLNVSILWTGPGINPSNQNDQNPPIDQPGIYDVVVTDNVNGCTPINQLQVVVTQDTVAPMAGAGADGLLTCGILTQTLDGSGSSVGPDFDYVWEGPGINSGNFNDQSPIVDATGTYTMTVINTQNHCEDTDMVFVGLDDVQPFIAGGPDRTLTCAFPTAQLDATQSASGPNISFLWVGPGIILGADTPTPTVDLSGVYVLTITNAVNGCTNVDAVNVAEDMILPTVSAGNDQILTCLNAGTGVTLSSAGSSTGPNFIYLWTGPDILVANQALPNQTVLVPGLYTLQISNTVNGCSQTNEVEVVADQGLPTALAGPDRVITCSLTDATLDGSGSSTPNGTLVFLWNGPGINQGNQNGDMPTVLVSGLYTLTVTNSVTGCTATDQAQVTLDNLPPTAIATSETITCLNQVSTVSVTSSLLGSTYHWEGPDVNQNTADDQTLQVNVAGLYAVTVTAPNGCTTTTSTIVDEDGDVPQGDTEGSVLNCLNGGTTEISGEVVSPPGSTFAWTGPGIIGTLSTQVITVTQAGTYTFTISAPNGCVRPFFAQVIADFEQPAVVLAAANQIDCNTSEVIIDATASTNGPSYSYFWTTTDGHFVSGTNTLSPLVNRAGEYQLRIVNNLNGCSDSMLVDVLVDPLVPSGFDVTVNNIKCFGDTNGAIAVNGIQGGTAPFIFSLSGNTGSANNQYTGLEAGEYVLSLEDANGCHLDTTITIGEPGLLRVELGPDIEINLGEYATVAAQIQSTIGVRFVDWNYAPGCSDTIPSFCDGFTYQPFDSYRHVITVVDSNGCVVRDEILIIVKKVREVYVPNIFDPNSLENYGLTVYAGIDVAKINSFRIFDRWGDEVFEAKDFLPNDLTSGWNGTVKGDKGQLGVYVWYCEVEFIDGETKLFKGDVTLVR